MYWSKTLIPTLRKKPQEAETLSHILMLRAGLIRMLMAGVYSYLPLGLRVLNNIEKIIREEMNASGAAELLLPALQPQELWKQTGRDNDLGEVMIKFIDRRSRKISLGPTHEEVITDLVKNYISSYRQLPLILYQIQTKFRDEIRPRFGLIRACEFIMKDAYSFDKDEQGLDSNYQVMYQAYNKIFKRCGLEFLVTEADPGVMGGAVSHEFMVPAADGEDIVLTCPKCKAAKANKQGPKSHCSNCGQKMEQVNTIEVGHVFKLGTKYSACLGANFLDAKGELKPIIMGCYGIGVSRLISAIIEQNNDKDGIVWPREVAPYEVLILPLEANNIEAMKIAKDIYEDLTKNEVEVLLDDRDERAGVKFKDADLIGVPLQIIIGDKSLKDSKIEIKARRNKETCFAAKNDAIKKIKELLVDI